MLAPASARARDPDLDASNEDLFVALAAAAALSVCGNMAGGDTRRASGSGRQSKRAKTAKSTAVPTWQPGIADEHPFNAVGGRGRGERRRGDPVNTHFGCIFFCVLAAFR